MALQILALVQEMVPEASETTAHKSVLKFGSNPDLGFYFPVSTTTLKYLSSVNSSIDA